MNSSPTSKTPFVTGRRVLLVATLGLLISILALIALGIFGSREQFTRAKDMLPILIGVLTPLLAGVIACYLRPPS